MYFFGWWVYVRGVFGTGVIVREVFVQGICPGAICSGGICPRTRTSLDIDEFAHVEYMYNWYLKITKLPYLGLSMSSGLVVGKYSGSMSRLCNCDD